MKEQNEKTKGVREPEPLAAILAEMREYNNTPPPKRAWLDLADRIEAAAEREREEWHSETEAAKDARNRVACRMRSEFAEKCRNCTERVHGSAAAMREALEKFLDFSRRGLAFVTSYRYTEAENAEIEAAFDEAKAALAAPARNCDRFATHNEAKAAFLRSYFGPTEPEFVEDAFARWLFATAEGGAE